MMKLMKVKTARFGEVVEHCGKPQSYTLWRKPSEDARLKKLLAQNHIMTIHHQNGGADFGDVGLHEQKGATYLAFPKSLRPFQGKRIVGIKCDLVDQAL